mmetsp:Transcript_64146/g.153194  ORF Transcript_64146/g.153194 Transcript_64146/m.153194 type:complete len:92 (+) Transcript_64146:80-355(+)
MIGDSGGSCSTAEFGTQCSVQPVMASAASQTQIPAAPPVTSIATGTDGIDSVHKCTQTPAASGHWPYVTAVALLTAALAVTMSLSTARRKR